VTSQPQNGLVVLWYFASCVVLVIHIDIFLNIFQILHRIHQLKHIINITLKLKMKKNKYCLKLQLKFRTLLQVYAH